MKLICPTFPKLSRPLLAEAEKNVVGQGVVKADQPELGGAVSGQKLTSP